MDIERAEFQDYAVPSFIDWTKYYYGTSQDIDMFIAKTEEQPTKREKGIVLAHKLSKSGKGEYAHINIYNCPYNFKWDETETETVWAQFSDDIVRCTRARLKNLIIAGNECLPALPVHDSWGLPGIMQFSSGYVINSLMEYEKSFANREEAEKDYNTFNGTSEFHEFFNDILGDG